MGDPRQRLAQALEIGIFAPIGIAAVIADHLPQATEIGRQRVQRQIVVARFIGQVVVQQGRREIERRLEPRLEPDVAGTTGEPNDLAPLRRSAPTAVPAEKSPDVDQLAIDDYESLAASQVISLLSELDPAELEQIEAFERAHRSRRTIIGRIAQLRSTP